MAKRTLTPAATDPAATDPYSAVTFAAAPKTFTDPRKTKKPLPPSLSAVAERLNADHKKGDATYLNLTGWDDKKVGAVQRALRNSDAFGDLVPRFRKGIGDGNVPMLRITLETVDPDAPKRGRKPGSVGAGK